MIQRLRSLLTIDRLAPELKSSRWARAAAGVSAALVLGLAAGGTALGFWLKDSRPGTTIEFYHSYEPFGQAAGARLIYYPEMKTVVVKGWLMDPLRGRGVYQVWAVEEDGYKSLGMADALDYVGFALVAEGADLRGVDRIVISIEPPGGSLTGPTRSPLVELIPGA